MDPNTKSRDDVKPLSERMRVSTRDVHDKSDRLVNIKLALVLTSRTLYGESISLFAAIFECLESILERQKSHRYLGRFHELLPCMSRFDGFQADMSYYLSPSELVELKLLRSGVDGGSVVNCDDDNDDADAGGTTVVSPPDLADYLNRLDYLERNDPVRLLAYIYHMYMAIFAGGYIIQKIVRKSMRLGNGSNDGVQAFCIKENATNMGNDNQINVMNGKRIRIELKRIIDEVIAPLLCEDEIQGILEESREVFRRNNAVVDSVKATSAFHSASIRFRNLVLIPTVAILIGAIAIVSHPSYRRKV